MFFSVQRIIIQDQNEKEIKMLQRWLKILTNTIIRNENKTWLKNGFIPKLSSSNWTEYSHIIPVQPLTTPPTHMGKYKNIVQ